LAGWYGNTDVLYLATILDVLAVYEMETRDHNGNRRVVVDKDDLAFAAQGHFGA